MDHTSPPLNRHDNTPEMSVSELSSVLKRTLETSFNNVRIRGEISGLKKAASGHIYLVLKDGDAAIDGIIWRGKSKMLRFRPEDGLEVVVTGNITTFPGRSKYQIIIDTISLQGAGALMAVLEQRKQNLIKEGLFSEERKKPLPFLPKTIGIITSLTGAVIQDILHRISDRCPTHLVVWGVLVQGEEAPAQISAAIDGFNALPESHPSRPELLIVARGGGSLEDLWAFNEEIVVRAAANSHIPLISAVGHETDTTLIDYASDKRAPTPTAAAEFAVPVLGDLVSTLNILHNRIINNSTKLLQQQRLHLNGLKRGLHNPADLLALKTQRLDDITERLRLIPERHLTSSQAALAQVATHLRPSLLNKDINDRHKAVMYATNKLDNAVNKTLTGAAHAITLQNHILESVGLP